MEFHSSFINLMKPLDFTNSIKPGRGPQLAVVAPLDILRQQLLFKFAKHKVEINRDDIKRNKRILESFGK